MSRPNSCFHENLYNKEKLSKYVETLIKGHTQKAYAQKIGISEEHLSRIINGKISGQSISLPTLRKIYMNSWEKPFVDLKDFLSSAGYIYDEIKIDFLNNLDIDDSSNLFNIEKLECKHKPSNEESLRIRLATKDRLSFGEVSTVSYNFGYLKAITDITKEMLLNCICNPNITVREAFEKHFQSLSYEQKGEVMEEYLKKKSEKESEEIEIEEELER